MNAAVNSVLESAVLASLEGAGGRGALLAAVSGGADSTAMLYALWRLRDKTGRGIYCCHVQHNLRGEESAEDALYVAGLCSRLGIACTVAEIAPGKIKKEAREKNCGIEAAAREERFAVLKKEARRVNAEFILIAHNKNDLLENIIIRILRGAGPAGLAPIPARGKIILRPLISLTRNQITDYLAVNNISHRIDSTNLSDDYLRGKIRNHLIPVLRDFFPGWEKNLERMAETQKFVSAYIKSEALKRKKNIIKNKDGSLEIKKFYSLKEIIREELLFDIINALSAKGGSFSADAENKKNAPPRRASVRKLCSGLIKNAVFSQASFKAAPDGSLAVKGKKSRTAEEGFSILIENEGSYSAGDVRIECVKHGGGFKFVVRKS